MIKNLLSRKEWLLERQKSIGASDAANLLGVGFSTALDVYKSKIEEPSDRVPRNGFLARGIALESIVAAQYAEVMDCPEILTEDQNGYRIAYHPDRSWQTCSPDRLRSDGLPVQLKTCTGFGSEWGTNGSDKIPQKYRTQVTQEMGILNSGSCDLAALDVIAFELRIFRIPFDEVLFDYLSDVEHEFYHKHVLPKVPPTAAWYDQFREADDKIVMTANKHTELPSEAVELLEKRKEFNEIEKEAKHEQERLSKRIEQLMGDAHFATAGSWNLKRVNVKAAPVSYERDAYSFIKVHQPKGKQK